MSSSTVAITANPAVNNNPSLALGSKPNARRRAVVVTEKKSNIEVAADGGGVSEAGIENVAGGKDLSHSIRGETVIERPKDLLQAKKNSINSTVSPRRSKKVILKPEKPWWQRGASSFIRNVLLIVAVLGLLQMMWKSALKSGDNAYSSMGVSSDYEGRIAEVEAFVKTTTKMMQVQVEIMDRKLTKVEDKGALLENEMKKLEVRTEGMDKSLGELTAAGFFTKEDFERFSDELKKSRSREESDRDWSLDEIRAFAKEIVTNEIERHAADGLGRVDYALASGGAMIIRHSEPYLIGKGRSWFPVTAGRNVHSEAQKMLQPSFGEPGQCFPLTGSSGFVEIRLRKEIILEAVTLEHVAKNVAYDRSSAPKDCRVSAWLQRRDADPSSQAEKMFLLTEFTYDLEKSNAQTFNVDSVSSDVVNVIRFDFTSNHGSPSHTCIYRLRVHGYEPDSVVMLATES